MTSKQVVILHGTQGNPEENWFPWLASQIQARGHEAIVPRFPTPDDQTLSSWLEVFRSDVGSLDHGTLLIGHSLGAAFALRLLEDASQPITGTFLVSGFLGELGIEDFDPLNAPFFETSFDWPLIREMGGEMKAYNGDNDPYVPIEKGSELATNLGIQLTVVPNGGHINASSGFTRFDLLLQDLDPLLSRP